MIRAAIRSLLWSLIQPMANAEFVKLVFFWAAEWLVESTETPHDNEFLDMVKEVHNDSVSNTK